MSTAPARHLPRIDRPALFFGTIGILAHGGMLLLDASLVTEAWEAWQPGRPEANVGAAALVAVVMFHLAVLAWCGRRVAEYAEVIGDGHLASFTRRNRARAAARRAASALFASSGLAPVLLLVSVLAPALLR